MLVRERKLLHIETLIVATGVRAFPEVTPAGPIAVAERVCRMVSECMSGTREFPWEGSGAEVRLAMLRSLKKSVRHPKPFD